MTPEALTRLDYDALVAGVDPGAAAPGEPWSTPEGIDVPVRVAASAHALGMPGFPPYRRGPYPTMYVGPSVDDPSVRRLLHRRGQQRVLPQNLAAGQKGLSIAFDLATHRGYDSDHPRVVGDVGHGRASRSTRSSTCGSCSTASRSIA